MSILDLAKGMMGGDQGGLMKVAQDLLGDGLGDVQKQLEAAGLGDKLKSWIGQGDNEPVTPEEMRAAFGEDKLNEMAEKAGEEPDTLLEKLAAMLPELINQATPEGDASKIGDTFKGLLGKLPRL